MNSADVAGLLELVAGERPDLLRPMVKALEFSRAAASVAELAAKTSGHLDQLQRRRGFALESRVAALEEGP